MANFTRVKPAGWALNEIVTSAQLTQLDVDHAKSVNGDDGGSWGGPITWLGAHTFNALATFNRHRVTQAGGWGSVPDANTTIDVSKSVWEQTVEAVGDRTITLRHSTAPIPQVGERIRYVETIPGMGFHYVFKREDATVLADLTMGGGSWVEFEYTAAGWKCVGIGGTSGGTRAMETA